MQSIWLKTIKLLIVLTVFSTLSFLLHSDVVDVKEIVFEGVNFSESGYEVEADGLGAQFNIAYSPFLPAGGVYSVTDVLTGKEAIIQVGHTKVNKSPYVLYLSDSLFAYFLKGHEEETARIELKLKFLAWNKNEEGSFYLNLHTFVVRPEDSFDEISKNGSEKHYIQIGAFSFYQNSYPVIISMMPYLRIIPHFYMLEKEVVLDDVKRKMYRVLVGPYKLEVAREIAKEINAAKNTSVFIHSWGSIMSEYGEPYYGEER